MKTTPEINPDSQDAAALQAKVRQLMAEKQVKEDQWKQERQTLLEQFKLAIDLQFSKRAEALKPYDDAQGDLFNEAECEAHSTEQEDVATTTKKPCGKRKPLPTTLPIITEALV